MKHDLIHFVTDCLAVQTWTNHTTSTNLVSPLKPAGLGYSGHNIQIEMEGEHLVLFYNFCTLKSLFLSFISAKPAPLEIKPLPEWEELQAPVRSPITRSFARE